MTSAAIGRWPVGEANVRGLGAEAGRSSRAASRPAAPRLAPRFPLPPSSLPEVRPHLRETRSPRPHLWASGAETPAPRARTSGVRPHFWGGGTGRGGAAAARRGPSPRAAGGAGAPGPLVHVQRKPGWPRPAAARAGPEKSAGARATGPETAPFSRVHVHRPRGPLSPRSGQRETEPAPSAKQTGRRRAPKTRDMQDGTRGAPLPNVVRDFFGVLRVAVAHPLPRTAGQRPAPPQGLGGILERTPKNHAQRGAPCEGYAKGPPTYAQGPVAGRQDPHGAPPGRGTGRATLASRPLAGPSRPVPARAPSARAAPARTCTCKPRKKRDCTCNGPRNGLSPIFGPGNSRQPSFDRSRRPPGPARAAHGRDPDLN